MTMRTLEEHTKEFNYKLKNIKFDFSAEHLILVAEELETGEYAHIDEYITLSGKMLRQQQAEIETLKSVTKSLSGGLEASLDMNKAQHQRYWSDLSKAEIESGLSRVKWAELLIKQLPEKHEGRNSWLLNYGSEK